MSENHKLISEFDLDYLDNSVFDMESVILYNRILNPQNDIHNNLGKRRSKEDKKKFIEVMEKEFKKK